MCKFNPKNDGRKIDPCISSFIRSLQSAGFKTLSSCCGHNKYPLTVVIETHPEGREPFIVELISGAIIKRKKKLYKKDKEGCYFIPETIMLKEIWKNSKLEDG